MTWETLCGGRTVTGTKVTPGTLSSDHAKRQPAARDAIPNIDTLTAMITSAQGLRLKSPPKPRSKKDKGKKVDGIAFHVARCNIGAAGLAVTTVLDQFVGNKSGAAVCYENSILPGTIADGHILIHQGVAPCTRCRAGYSAWAVERRCTIVVDADLEYDGSGAAPTFLFLPTGAVLYDSQ